MKAILVLAPRRFEWVEGPGLMGLHPKTPRHSPRQAFGGKMVVLDTESHGLLLMVEGRSAQAVTEFLAAMPAHRAKAEAITEVVLDMSPA